MGEGEKKDGSCKRHPTHMNSKGVCPYCLRDKLANFPSWSSSSSAAGNNAASSTASSAAYSSCDSQASSFDTSPPHGFERAHRNALQSFAGSRREMLRKSKSISSDCRNEERTAEEKKRSSKAGKLWAMLMKTGRRWKQQSGGGSGGGGLLRSKTTKEKPSSKWTFISI